QGLLPHREYRRRWIGRRFGPVTRSTLQERLPILRLGPGLEGVKRDAGKLAAERGGIERVADVVEPLVHLRAVVAHALAEDVGRDLVVGERLAGDGGEDGDHVVARELVPPEVEALAGEAARVLENGDGDRPDVGDGDLRELAGRRQRVGVDTLGELFPPEI